MKTKKLSEMTELEKKEKKAKLKKFRLMRIRKSTAERNELKPVIQGRPTKYHDELPDLVFKYFLLGAKEIEVCEFLDINPATFQLWLEKHKKFSVAVREGKGQCDANVALSLYRKACGYEREEEELKIVSIGNGQSEVQRHKITRWYPPDTTAASFWLRNRRSTVFKDRHEITGADGESISITIEAVGQRIAQAVIADTEEAKAIDVSPVDNSD